MPDPAMVIVWFFGKSKNTLSTLFFTKIRQKIGDFFFTKIPYYTDQRFRKSWIHRSTFFLTSFSAVCGSLLADYLFWQKKSKNTWVDIFFFVISVIKVVKKVLAAGIDKKWPDITFKVKDITFFTSVPYFGIKCGYRLPGSCYLKQISWFITGW